MAWLDSRVWCHPKMNQLTDRAFRVHINAIAYSDGFGTRGVLSPADQRTIGATPRIHRELVAAGLWDERNSPEISEKKSENELVAVAIHDWGVHNGKRDDRREADRERKRAARAKASAGQSAGASTGQSLGRSAGHGADKPADGSALTGDRVTGEEEPPAAANGQSAAAAERLQALGLDADALLDAHTPELVTAWLDVADAEAETNAAGFVLTGLRGGQPPSPRATAVSPTTDYTQKAREFYERTHDLERVADWLAGLTISMAERDRILEEIAA